MFYFSNTRASREALVIPFLLFLIVAIACINIVLFYVDYTQLNGLCIFSELIISSLPLVKPRFSKAERESLVLSEDTNSILVGLLLGDLYGRKQKKGKNTHLCFAQGLVHEAYLLHLYNIFEVYCPSVPKIITPVPDKRTGKTYSTIRFQTRALPCFNSLYELFYIEGIKTVPSNIFDLLTPLGLAYFLCDDGTFCKINSSIVLCTECFSLREVQLLQEVLENKFKIKCALNARGNGFRVRIPKKGLPVVQALLKDIMPPMMKYKIGL